jgi:hypothetical protein
MSEPAPATATFLCTCQILSRPACTLADGHNGERHRAEGSRQMLDICLAPAGRIYASRRACSLDVQPVASQHYGATFKVQSA